MIQLVYVPRMISLRKKASSDSVRPSENQIWYCLFGDVNVGFSSIIEKISPIEFNR